MRPRRPVLLSLVLLAVLSGAARADVRAGDSAFLHGDYPAALAAYQAATGEEALRGVLGTARTLMATGEYARAEGAAQKAAKGKDKKVAAEATILVAELARATGKSADARNLLEGLLKKDAKNLRARVLLGRLYQDAGDKAKADHIWNQFFDEHDAGKLDEKNPQVLVYLGVAARYLEDFEGAKDTFQDALRLDGTFFQADLEFGEILLEKYNAGDAEESFDEILKTNPKNADAHAAMARVRIEQNYDYRGALEEIALALAVNPHHAGALRARAELEIDNNEYTNAEKTLADVLAVNPEDLEAHALRATLHWLQDDLAGFEAEKTKVFAANPRYAAFYHIVSDFAVKEHRYKEAIALGEEAIKVDPKYYLALADIGSGYLRMGDEKKGLEYLERAYKGDRFNVRTYNLLNLFQDWIPAEYEVINPSATLRFRMPKDERQLLERYVPRTLDRAFADMAKRYGFTPSLPVTIEMYSNPDYYGVRTIGLPNLGGALGVCFGQVITALAPSNGNLNWGMILWHELGHVFAIQLSNSRVPRWFTEGLSEYETLTARPEWRRENEVDMWTALEGGTLPSVLELNSRFLRASNINDMVVAYYMSTVTVDFIAHRWGFPKIVEALKLYGQGKQTAEVIQKISGLAPADFDIEFTKYLGTRLAVYKGSFKVVPAMYSDVSALEKAVAARPDSAEAQAGLAIGYLAAHDLDKAQATDETALKLDGQNKKALYVAAEVALAQGNIQAANEKLVALVHAGGDGYDARLRLGQIAMQMGDSKAAEEQLGKAKKLDPERSEPYQILSELYFKANREEDGLKELERYVYIEQMEYPPLRKLVQKYALKKRWDKVKEFGEMALYVNPYDPDLHLSLGEAYLALAAPDNAAYEYESALLADPPLRRPAVAHIGAARAYLAKKDAKRAASAVAAALKLEPENADALAVKKQLGRK